MNLNRLYFDCRYRWSQRVGNRPVTPDVLAVLFLRIVLHGLIAWLVWTFSVNALGPVTQIYGGLIPALIFSMMALATALKAVRGLPEQIYISSLGFRLHSGAVDRTFGPADILSLAPVSPVKMAWHLLWPVTPWRVITMPNSLQDWWRIDTTNGHFFCRRTAADVLPTFSPPHTHQVSRISVRNARLAHELTASPNKIRPFRIAIPWELEVAVWSALVMVERTFLIPMFFFIGARLSSAIWLSHKKRRWQGLKIHDEQSIRTSEFATGGFPVYTGANLCVQELPPQAASNSTHRLSGRTEAMLSPVWFVLLLPLRLVVALGNALSHVPQIVRLVVGQTLHSVVTLFAWAFQSVPQIWQVLFTVARLWRTVLLTLAGWLAALLVGFPLALMFADSEEVSWSEPWMVRAALFRFSGDAAAMRATAMLQRAKASGDPVATEAVLLGGSTNGVFQIIGWQTDRREKAVCRDAVPQIEAIRLQLNEQLDTPTLLREVKCDDKPGYLQADLLVNAYQRGGGYLDIFQAVASGSPVLLPLVLDKESVLEVRDWQGRTPLLLALDLAAEGGVRRAGWFNIAQLLLQRGADIAAADHGGRSATYLAVQAGMSGELLKPFLGVANAHGASALGATLVHAAASSGVVATLENILEAGVAPRSRTHDGRSAMHFARGEAMVDALFKHGVSVNLRDKRGRLPLHAAVLAKDSSAALALTRLTHNPQTVDHFGRMPIDYAPIFKRKLARHTNPMTESAAIWSEVAKMVAARASK